MGAAQALSPTRRRRRAAWTARSPTFQADVAVGRPLRRHCHDIEEHLAVDSVWSQWVGLCAGVGIAVSVGQRNAGVVVAVGRPLRRRCHAPAPTVGGLPADRVAVGRPLRRRCHTSEMKLETASTSCRSGSASAQALSFPCPCRLARASQWVGLCAGVVIPPGGGNPGRQLCRSGSASAQALSLR